MCNFYMFRSKFKLNKTDIRKGKHMKDTKEMEARLFDGYKNLDLPVNALALELGVPDRSIIAKLSSMGIYKRKKYVNKRGEVPIKKSEQIEKLAKLLDVNIESLESLEKVNKSVLILLEAKLSA